MAKDNLLRLAERVDAGLPACTCGGTGYIRISDEGQGTISLCPGCTSQRIVRQFGGKDGAQTWANWERRPELDAAVIQLRSWFDRWRTERLWVCLLHAPEGKDNFGSGKSHACQATAHEWAAHGLPVRYVVWEEYLESVKAGFGDLFAHPASIADFEGLVILDDIGTEKATDWSLEEITGATGWRYRQGLPTLITTNLDVEGTSDKPGLRRRYPRLYSRCHEGIVIPWWAPDWRRR